MNQEKTRLEKIARFYNSETANYDEGYSSLVCKAEDMVVARMLGRVIGGKVLDIGAGNGLLCEMMSIDGYVGIELSPEMTHQAKVKFPDKNFMIGDMHKLPFKNDSFDSAVSLYGPVSYSLSPFELLNEIVRVVKPGGHIALMPYTLRVGHKLEMGGYSTATEDSIEKIFYTSEELRELLSPLESVEVYGVNYFLNTYTNFVKEMSLSNNQSIELFVEFLEREMIFGDILPAEFARHMIGIGMVLK